MTGDNIFKEYLEKEESSVSNLIKKPKFWVFLVSFVMAIILGIFYLKSVRESMSAKEVADSVEIAWHETTWVDKEVTPQEVKIVPAIRFKIKNVGKRSLAYMDIEAVFHFVESGSIHSDGMARILTENPLLPGEISEEIYIRSLYGYSATSRSAFLKNKQEWKKMEVKLFARAKGSGLIQIGDVYPIKQVIEGFNGSIPAGEELPEDYADETTRQLARSIRITQQDSLWVDKLFTEKEVIIVPSISLTIKNVGTSNLQYLYFKGVFKFADTGEILSEGITPALKKSLSPGESSDSIEIKGEYGFSASSKHDFYQQSQQRWKFLKVNLYAKSKESDYALLGIFPVKAKIQGVNVINQ